MITFSFFFLILCVYTCARVGQRHWPGGCRLLITGVKKQYTSCATCPVPNPNNLGCIKITLARANALMGFVDFIPKYLTSANRSLIVYELD